MESTSSCSTQLGQHHSTNREAAKSMAQAGRRFKQMPCVVEAIHICTFSLLLCKMHFSDVLSVED
jgi:hypothetical protein